jgi:hypothetical protein
MILFMLCHPANAFQQRGCDGLIKMDTAALPPNPHDGPERLGPVDSQNRGCADTRWLVDMDPASLARDVFQDATNVAAGEDQPGFKACRQTRGTAIAQFAKGFLCQHTGSGSMDGVNNWLCRGNGKL